MKWISANQEPEQLIGLALLFMVGDEPSWAKGYYNKGNYYVDGSRPFKYDVIAWMLPDLTFDLNS